MSAIFKPGNTAVITGGASGIGLALAKKCVGYGMKALIADLNDANLEKAKETLVSSPSPPSSSVTTVQMDVGRLEDWKKLKEAVQSEFGGQINLLALNAGTGIKTSFLPSSAPAEKEPTDEEKIVDAFQKTLSTNFFGVVNGIATLLPLVREHASENHKAAVVITGSKQGITNPPGNPAYNASKAAVKTVAEHLSHDLRGEKDRISVHLLVPGWTWTNLAGAASGQPKPEAAWYPEQVADYLESKMNDGQFWVLCPDNDVTEDTDRKRMLWNARDAVEGRLPLSRWRDEHKEEFGAWMGKDL